MEHLSLSVVNLRTNKENAIASNQVFLNKSPTFQRSYGAWDEKMKTRFIESILLNRATNPIWTVFNEDDESEEILDGMHRITTALSFLNNEFSLNKNYLISLSSDKYNKSFSDLEKEDKSKIRNYNFIFNKLDSSYKKDLNKLRDMYEILNRSSRTLTDYEFSKVILSPFYDIISKHKKEFLRSSFFSKIKDNRGSVDTELIEMVALTFELPNCWTSINNLKEDWIKRNIGETSESVVNYITLNGQQIENKMIFMTKIINDFYQQNLFSTEPKLFKKFFLPYKLIISRCCCLINNYPLFNRICSTIIHQFLESILVDDIQKQLDCTSRNASFQRRLIDEIDKIIENQLNTEGIVRKFSKKNIEDKLLEQKHHCAKCNEKIKDVDEYQGDHIIPWTAGGKTIPTNLQVLHKRCHQLKSAL